MSGQGAQASVEAYVVEGLARAAEDVVDQWLEQLQAALGIRPSRLLPTEALRDHIPEVIQGLAHYLALPTAAMRSEVTDRLRLLAELRREQGYDVQEILAEFEALSKLVTSRVRELVEDYPGEAEALEVLEMSEHLREGLSAITAITVGWYREQETEQERELSRRLSEYAHTIAHEIKNPLNAAQATALLLREDDIDRGEYGRFLELILRSLRRIEDLVDDIGVVAIEEGARARERWLPLRTVVERVFEEVRPAALKREVALEVEGELPDTDVDASRVEIALVNLVGNAVKYSDADEDERWVLVGAERKEPEGDGDGGWLIRVADNGLGIPDSVRNHVFRRHFRGHPDVADGTGLGLAITRHVVMQHGGTIRFESSEGEGTTFYVTIPDRRRDAKEPEGRERP